MKTTVDDPRTAQPDGDPQPGEKDFLRITEHVPEKIDSAERDEFKEVQPPQAAAAAAPGWTSDEVAHIFAGFFMILSFPLTRPLTGFGGEHWSIPDEQCRQLGRAWLPIFQKHIPHDRKPGIIADLFMWLPALGAVKTVCTSPLKMEIALLRQKKKIAIEAARQRAEAAAPPAALSTTARSTMASTATAISPA